MTHARARCWIHEDCLIDLELSIACGPNPLDMQALDGDWAEEADLGGGYSYGGDGDGYFGYGWGGGDNYGYGGDGGGDGWGGGGGWIDGGQR